MGRAPISRIKGRKVIKQKVKKTKQATIPRDPQIRALWEPLKSLQTNYRNIGLTLDVNNPDEAPTAATKPLVFHFENAPPRPPKELRLNKQEIGYYKALYTKHGDNYKSMALDIRLNPWQKTPKELKKKMTLYLEKYHERQLDLDAERKANAAAGLQSKRQRKRDKLQAAAAQRRAEAASAAQE
eukprot:TRINITY_DN1573_c0_g1_i2.p1 TRINITY_DN1573_c0_g1~~TRINITY_DN1573_c0_g1_i2.p1  ORF type:complete len:184 (-),score=45.87 TRINITY_DN1573_c0_g1_i2:152-703(-)